jgi:tetrahydromethanopterin S-methyltransferase subunit A
MAAAETSATSVITEQLQAAIAAPKCHKCGCLQQTVAALARTDAGQAELSAVLAQARSVFVPKKYDCLGCAVCYPALAANAFVEAYPEAGGDLDLCPTEAPEERQGWPPLPGDYAILRYRAPVAVCALNSEPLARSVADRRPDGLAIIGTLHTENLGIERIIKNTLANPHIRFLLLCGEDTQQLVGHLPGQSFASLFRNGLDERGRIIGAKGKRPVLKNVSREEVHAFVRQVELVPMIGEERPEAVARQIGICAERNPGPSPHPVKDVPIERIEVPESQSLTLDKAGYFVVYPDARAGRLVVEHYTNPGVLDCVLEGGSPGAIYTAAIERQLLTRLDHAAYLGRELARAERSLLEGTPFVQDAAPGEIAAAAPEASCGADGACGCSPAPQTEKEPLTEPCA